MNEETSVYLTESANSTQPLFYMAFILQGTEKQYLDLLKYLQQWNQARIIYQKRSLTYLFIADKEPET